jgi:putative peptide zinc metalloprotease protein
MRLVRRFATVKNLAAAVATMVALAPAAAMADNAAVAINTKDGSTMIRIAFKIERVMQDSVTTSNAAVAISSCSACQTVAIAIDVVFVMSDPQVYTPTNLALAYNVNCSSCNTLADAYQFVMTTGGAVHLTPEGNREVAGIRRQLEALRHSDANIFEIQAQVSSLMVQLRQVLSTQVVPAGPPDQAPADQAQPSPSGGPSGSPAASPSSSPGAQPSASPSPSPSPST